MAGRSSRVGSRLIHPVVVVTGGSRGIGAAVARLAGRAGYAVAVMFHRETEAAQGVVADVHAVGSPAVAVRVDVSQEDQVVAAFAAVDTSLGPVQALVNNAGVLEGGKRVAEIGQQRLTRIAREVAAEGVRVNAVRPGFIETDIHRRGGDPDRLLRLAPTLPLGRAGQPEEVAEAVLWLLSERASYVTGAFIDLAGGR